MSRTVLIQMVGNNLYHLLLYGLHTILVHTLPCVLLVFFTWRLIAAIRKADKKHSYLVGRNQLTQRKYTTAGILPDENGGAAVQPILVGGVAVGRYSMDEGAQWSCVSVAEPVAGGGGGDKASMGGRSSISESKRVQGLKQNTRMLLAVILLFLVTEIPAALIFSVHVGTVALKFTFIINHYAVLNKLLIVRNVLIVISYPLRFAIYCGMSAQFREVVQQMLTKRHKFLFFPWLRFPYGKLYTKEAAGGRSSGGSAGGDGSPPDKKTSKTSVVLQKASVVWRSADGGGGIRAMAPGNNGKQLDRRATMTAITEVSGGNTPEPTPQLQQRKLTAENIEEQQQQQHLAIRSSDEPDEDELSECRL